MREYTLKGQHAGAAEAAPAVSARLVNPCISHRFSPVSATGAAVLSEHVKQHGDQPVARIQVFRRDIIVTRVAEKEPNQFVETKRGMITEFSLEARLRLLHFAKNCNADFRSMLTITYPRDFPRDGKQVKRDLDAYKKWLRREVPDLRGIWFLEFQKRGAPHFHFLLDVDLRDQGKMSRKRRTGVRRGEKSESYQTCVLCELRASKAWYRIVGSGDERHLRAGVCWEQLEENDAALRYAAKHAGKPKQKSVPEEYTNVGRFWGKIGPVEIEDPERIEITTEELFKLFGVQALSNKGRVKKFLWDAAENVTIETPEELPPDEIPF